MDRKKKNLFPWLGLGCENKEKKEEKEKKPKLIEKDTSKKCRSTIEILQKSENRENRKFQPEDKKNIQCQTESIKTTSIITLSKQTTTLPGINEQKKIVLMQQQKKLDKESFFIRLKKGLLKTQQNFGVGFISFFRGKKIDEDLFKKLEEQLLVADVGTQTTKKIIDRLTTHANHKDWKDATILYKKLREEMTHILSGVDTPSFVAHHLPYVVLVVGVNGVGKTTTIGKLAHQYQEEGKSVMLAAGDTFRAAAIEQLQVWGARNNIPVVSHYTGADPASVIFDAMRAAKTQRIDVLLVDTAGRLQNKTYLMEELKKIVRVMKKLDQHAPNDVMLILDANTGQNAINQVKSFHKEIGLTGIILTKLDGTAKGGIIFSIADQCKISIRYIGIGEEIADLRPFVARDFIKALFVQEY